MDIILKNGKVFDGSKAPPIVQDVYIKNNKIEKIATNIEVEGTKIIDCSNLNVAPGFIDAHSHNDFFLEKEIQEKSISPFIKQGITTQVVGNCGFSAYGIHSNSTHKNEIGGGLFSVAEPKSLAKFITSTEEHLMINIVPLIGHGTTRIAIAGKSAKKLSEEEMQEMLDITKQAMEEGAFGGSFGLMYQPGMFAPREELVAWATVIQNYDGILTVHPRANSKIALGYPLLGKPHIEQALDEVLDIVKTSGVRLEYSHLIFVGSSSWKCVDSMLQKFQKAKEEGFDIGYDMYPFDYGASVITVVLPSWYLKLTKEEKTKPWNRFKLKTIINVTKKLLGIQFSDMVISYIGKEYPQYEGKTISQIAQMEKQSEIDTYLYLVDISKGKGRMMLGKYYNEDIIAKLMQDDMSIYMTDAWYEESGTQNGGTFQAFPFFIQKANKLDIPLEHTIHKMTGQTAQRFKIHNRGFIKPGYYADITIFDDQNIQIDLDNPNTTPIGIHHVFINGTQVVDNGTYKTAYPGLILRKNNE